MSGTPTLREGGCACGALRYRVTGALRPVIACHCSQCRQAFTNFGAFTAASRAALVIDPGAPAALVAGRGRSDRLASARHGGAPSAG